MDTATSVRNGVCQDHLFFGKIRISFSNVGELMSGPKLSLEEGTWY